MKYFIKTVLYYLFFTVLCVICLRLIGSTILLTVFNAILDEFRGVHATNICMQIFLPIATAALTYVPKFKNAELRREYLKSSEGTEYDKRQDVRNVLTSREYIIEISVFAFIFIFISLFGDPAFFLYLIFCFVFAVFDLFAWTHLHRKWHAQRLRK